MNFVIESETSEHDPDVVFLHLSGDGRYLGTASISESRRCWVLGHDSQPRGTTHGKRRGISGDGYKGQGWRHRLEEDAKAALLKPWKQDG